MQKKSYLIFNSLMQSYLQWPKNVIKINFEIKDTGNGIQLDKIDQIFDLKMFHK